MYLLFIYFYYSFVFVLFIYLFIYHCCSRMSLDHPPPRHSSSSSSFLFLITPSPPPDQHPPPHHHHPHVAPPAFAPPQQDGPEQTARHGRSCAADRPRTQRRTRPWVGMWRCGEGGTDEAGTRDDGRVRFSMFTPPPPSLDRRRIGDDVHTAASSRKILRGQWRVTCR